MSFDADWNKFNKICFDICVRDQPRDLCISEVAKLRNYGINSKQDLESVLWDQLRKQGITEPVIHKLVTTITPAKMTPEELADIAKRDLSIRNILEGITSAVITVAVLRTFGVPLHMRLIGATIAALRPTRKFSKY